MNGLETVQFEENEIYEPLVDVFQVTVPQNDVSKQHNLYGEYDLYINPEDITMMRHHDIIFKWRYRNIRAYGRSKNSFVLEAGRKCQSGPGKFSFNSWQGEGEKIFASVQTQLKGIRAKSSQPNSPLTPTRSTLPLGDHGLPRTASNDSLPMALERVVKPRPPVKPRTPMAKPTSQPKPETRVKPTKRFEDIYQYEEVCPEPSIPKPKMSTTEINQIIFKQRAQAAAHADDSEEHYDSTHSNTRPKQVTRNYTAVEAYGPGLALSSQDEDEPTYDLVN